MFKNRSLTTRMMLNYAFSFMVIELASSASMIADELVISHNFNPTLLAATGLGGASYSLVMLFCSIFAIGLQTTCSNAMGEGDKDKISKYFTSGAIAIIVISTIVTVLNFIFIDPLCHLFGADGTDVLLYNGLHEYIRGWFVGIPGLMAFTVLCPLATLNGDKKLVMFSTCLQSSLNIIGDIFSVYHFRNNGLRAIYGIGFSSGMAFNIVSIILLISFFNKKSAFHFNIQHNSLISIAEMLHIGMPKLTLSICNILTPIIVNRTALAVGGTCAVVALSIKSSIASLFYVAGNGIGRSVNLLSQVFYSEKDKLSLQETAREAIRIIFVVCTFFSILIFVFSPQITSIFLPVGTEEYATTVVMMHYFSISLVLNALNCCVLNYLQGTRKILPAHIQTALWRFIFLAICTIVFGYSIGVKGIFLALPVSELLVFILYIVVSFLYEKDKSVPDVLLHIPSDFSYDEDKNLAFTVTKKEQIPNISKTIQDFCISNSLDKKLAFYSALCTEEIVSNIVEHGFTKDNKNHSCDVRVMIDNDDVILRIRDDCRYFNIKERYEVLKDKDQFSGIGIKLIYNIAKEINYIYIINTNTLMIRI